MRLLSAADRLAEPRGPKVLIVGLPGVGKTSLLKTLSPAALSTTLFVDAEAGDLAVAGLEVASVRPRLWSACRDLACVLGGANPALPSSSAYSETHFQAVAADPAMVELTKHQILFVDSLTEVSRQCRVWAEQQPESFTDRGKKDLRGTYGLVAREMIAWLQQIQHDRARTVILIAVLEKADDGFGSAIWRPQLEGTATGRQLPAIIDEVVTMAHLDFGDGKPVRALVCSNPNPWAFPAKDRSGKLDQLEPPDLGALLAKLTPPLASQISQSSNGESS
jgi:hypothetical protein